MLRRRLRTRPAADRGFALVLMALVLVSMLGIAGLVVDLGAWQVEASRIQQAADAASLAGVVRLPDGDAAAITRAREIAADNGFDDSDADVTVTVTPLGDETLEVAITKANVDQYFTQIFRDPTTITRRSTAQYVQPVPLGSPRNYLGTNRLLAGHPAVSGDAVENIYLAVSGECTRREFGDRMGPKAMANATSPHSCEPGVRGTRANPEWSEGGYLFGVSVPPENNGASIDIQMFDAPVCTDGAEDVIFGEGSIPFDVEVTVRKYDSLDPMSGTQIQQLLFEGESSGTGHCEFGSPDQGSCSTTSRLRECWTTLATVTDAGEYTVQVDPLFRGGNTRYDVFSLRAQRNGIFEPCTSDAFASPPNLQYHDFCTQVFAIEHLSIYAQGDDDPAFFLASIDPRHNGKTMQVTLYDAAEGAESVALLDPNGNPVAFRWDILCADGADATAGSCSRTGETDPAGGVRSGNATAPDPKLDVSGTGPQPWPPANNLQCCDKYNDRLLRLSVELPSDMATLYGNRTWWKLQYGGNLGGSTNIGDRTTWSVTLLGDPVRLVPNAPTTTTTTP